MRVKYCTILVAVPMPATAISTLCYFNCTLMYSIGRARSLNDAIVMYKCTLDGCSACAMNTPIRGYKILIVD